MNSSHLHNWESRTPTAANKAAYSTLAERNVEAYQEAFKSAVSKRKSASLGFSFLQLVCKGIAQIVAYPLAILFTKIFGHKSIEDMSESDMDEYIENIIRKAKSPAGWVYLPKA